MNGMSREDLGRCSVSVPITRIDKAERVAREDPLAIEEPLELRLSIGSRHHTLSITVRTPGDDVALALGFLVSEGVIRSSADVVEGKHVGPTGNVVPSANPGRVSKWSRSMLVPCSSLSSRSLPTARSASQG
jgi:formate dehydrogenase assembly factor FdhD